VSPWCRDPDLEPIPQNWDATEYRMGKHADMCSPPFPLRHIRAVVAAQLGEGRFESLGETRPAALLTGTLQVVAPLRALSQYRLHHPGPQVPVIRCGIAELAEQDRAAELPQPGGEQQRLDLVRIHAKVPMPQPLHRVARRGVLHDEASHQWNQALSH